MSLSAVIVWALDVVSDSYNPPIQNLIAVHFSCSTCLETLCLPSPESCTVSSVAVSY